MSAQGPNPYGRLYALLELARVRHLTSNLARHGLASCLFTTLTGLDVSGTFAASMDPETDFAEFMRGVEVRCGRRFQEACDDTYRRFLRKWEPAS